MDAPATLLYVITGTNTGGAEKALRELITRIDRSRYRVAVCSLKRPGTYAVHLATHADTFFNLGLSEAAGVRAFLNFIPATVRLALAMRRERPCIVHCLLFRASIMGRLAACLCPGTAVIAAVRVLEQSRLKYLTERMTRFLVDCYTAVSDEVRSAMIERAHIAPDKIVTVYNGIDCADNNQPGVSPSITHVPVRLALIGRLHYQKGHSVLFEALKSIIKTGKQVHLYLAGTGPEEERLRLHVRNLNIDASVTFSGVVDDPLAFMSDIDIVVLPSLWEGMPNVLLEAMAAGRPIVATRLGGIEELVCDGETALLCEPGSSASLTAAIMRLMDEPDLAQRLATAARRDVEERFDIARTVAATQLIYERLAGEKRTGRGGKR
jgi:glycosyltransferase involved in cell wall biosynthesis